MLAKELGDRLEWMLGRLEQLRLQCAEAREELEALELGLVVLKKDAEGFFARVLREEKGGAN